MPAPAAKGALDPAAPPPCPASSGRGGANINPSTGLSTDYLNHFTEAVMMLEMASAAPDCLDDLKAWRPKTYCEHFAGSMFSNRDAVLEAYRAADPAARAALERTAAVLDAMLDDVRSAAVDRPGDAATGDAARRTQTLLRNLITQAAAIINGMPGAEQGPQAAIDAMFGR